MPRLCGLCRQEGHDRRHCEQRDRLRQCRHEEPRQCTRNAAVGGNYCTQHERTRDRIDLPQEMRCGFHMCYRAAVLDGHGAPILIPNEFERNLPVCHLHLQHYRVRQGHRYTETYYNDTMNRQMLENPTRWQEIETETLDHRPPEDLITRVQWAARVRRLLDRLALDWNIRELWNANHPRDPMDINGVIQWHWDRRAPPGGEPAAPRPPPPDTLHAWAANTQNVHTAVISRQTNEGTAKLLDLPVDKNRDTIATIERMVDVVGKYRRESERTMSMIKQDVKLWYQQPTCRKVNDWFYKRVLDGAVTMVYSQEIHLKTQLMIRMFEEMKDSLGMCCEGHITRLVNIFCGFDESFKQEKSLGEQLQEFFAALAAKNCDVLEKTEAAVTELTKLKVPFEEWAPWVDAL